MTILDAGGRIILNGTISQTKQQVDVSELAKGVYFLKVENSIVRFIKE